MARLVRPTWAIRCVQSGCKTLFEVAQFLLDYIGFDNNRGALGIYPHGFEETIFLLLFGELPTEKQLEEFNYELPEDLIAQFPADKRDMSRMMVLDRASKTIEHRHF